MTSKECETQLKELIEAWDLDEATLNATDIEAIKHLLLEKPQLTGLGKLGKLNKNAHLIEQINPNTNEIINRYYGVCEAFRKTNINYKNIHAVLKNKRKTAGGYIWRYVNE